MQATKGEFAQCRYPFSSVFLRFCFFLKKYALFHPHFYKSASALTRKSHTGQNCFVKFFVKEYISTLKYRSYRSYMKFLNKIFIYIQVNLLRIWTNKNANEKARTFSRISKNVQKRTKNGYCRGRVEDTRLEAKDTKKSEAKAKDSLSEDRPSRGQGQECSRPRPRTKDTAASVLQKKKKVFKKSYSCNLQFIGVAKFLTGEA